MKALMYITFIVLLIHINTAFAQRRKPAVIRADSTTETKNPAFTKDTGLVIKNGDTTKVVSAHDPKKATLRSLILPGWGQAYNREYWKIPIVYGAIGTLAGIYVYNNTWYKRARDAFDIRVNRDTTADTALIHPKLLRYRIQDLQVIRNSFRRDRDYTALYFIIAWGLNIADATVFGHLRDFSVSEDLSLRVNPVFKTNGNAGLSLVLGFKPSSKTLPAVF